MTVPAGPSDAALPGADEPLLVVDGLTVRFPTHDGLVHAVTDLSFSVGAGRTLGIVGESGSGKSVAALAMLGLHDERSSRVRGSVRVAGTEIVGAGESTLRSVRGNDVAMVFQDPSTALHPFYPVGRQVAEAYRVHHDVSRKTARAKAIEMLDRVGIPGARSRADDYPHQLSGGMRQRAVIATALVNEPRLLIADEPTTALDVTVQAEILDLLRELQRDVGSAVVLITHDLGVVAENADEVLVMYAGRAVEQGPTRDVLTHPEMPYTWGLLSSTPRLSSGDAGRLVPISGQPPSLLRPPAGCAFHPRCPHTDKVAEDLCRTELPALLPGRRGPHHVKRCHLRDPDAIYEGAITEDADDRREGRAG